MGWKTVATGDEAKAAHSKAMAEAIHLDGGIKVAQFGDAFKKGWASGERILPASFGVAAKQGAFGAAAGAGIAMYQQRDVTAPFSLDGGTTMGVGATAAIGGLMAWKFGNRLKTSIYTGLGKPTTAAEAVQSMKKTTDGMVEAIATSE